MRRYYCLDCKHEYTNPGECTHCHQPLVHISEVHRLERFGLIFFFMASLLLLIHHLMTAGWNLMGVSLGVFTFLQAIVIISHENLMYELVYKDLHNRKATYYWIIWLMGIIIITLFFFYLLLELIPYILK